MMEVVQPCMDTAISKTVNIRVGLPYDDFKGLYLQAWRAPWRAWPPTGPTTSWVRCGRRHAAPRPPVKAKRPRRVCPVDPMRTVIESRPAVPLSAVAEKVEYWTQEGQKRLYLISFLPVPNAEGTGTVAAPSRFFTLPVGPGGESQRWVTSSVRLLSLRWRHVAVSWSAPCRTCARSPGTVARCAWAPTKERWHPHCPSGTTPKWPPFAYAIRTSWPAALSNSAIERDSGNATAARAARCRCSPAKCRGAVHAMIPKDGCDLCTQCRAHGKLWVTGRLLPT